MTLALSRDDAGGFLPAYVDQNKAGIFKVHPFQSLDQEGVGLLVNWGISKGRTTRPELKVGICGEHGGELDSVKFCHRAGMDYVSCSPYRVPIARLAAAKAVIDGLAASKPKKKARTRAPSPAGKTARRPKPKAKKARR